MSDIYINEIQAAREMLRQQRKKADDEPSSRWLIPAQQVRELISGYLVIMGQPVPKYHFLRKVERTVNFSFIHIRVCF